MYKIMIVDDDELIRKGLEQVIRWEQLGFTVEKTFSNAVEALGYLEQNSVDVILTDIKMPEMTGLELIDQAKTVHQDVKSIIISGYGEFELAKKALSLKVEDYLLKPLGQVEVENAFLKIRKTLDNERDEIFSGKHQKNNQECELIELLERRVHIEQPFQMETLGKGYYELIIIKIFDKLNVGEEAVSGCERMVQEVLRDRFYCHVKGLLAALILPDHLNGILMQLKKKFFDYAELSYKIVIGKEVYTWAEAVSSYWSAVDLIRKNGTCGVTHYDRERNQYKKEWDMIQNLKNELIRNLEDGKYSETETVVKHIHELLSHYDNKDIYYFYCNIVMKFVRYFELENPNLIFNQNRFSDINVVHSNSEQLRQDFNQDVDSIRNALRENSDSMRNIIVNKAKVIINQDYADDGLSLANLANRLHVSYGYLSTIFTKSTGSSFKTYLVEVRMEKARILLLSRKYKVYEIAEMVGYHNSRYFTDAFRKYYQCSPADYIARFRGDK